MRSAVIAAAFAAGAIAVPYQKRDVATEADVVYVTEAVTVSAGSSPCASPAAVELAPSTDTAPSA